MQTAPSQSWREIRIHGFIAERPTHGVGADELVSPSHVISEIDRARASDTRALLVSIDSCGGHVAGSLAICDALRAFSRAGGTVVTYIPEESFEHGRKRPSCASTATALALAGDVVVMHPRGRFTVHSMYGPDAASVADANRRMLDIYADRTRTPRPVLGTWLALVENDRGEPCKAELEADVALSYGWAHLVGDEQAARSVAAARAGEVFGAKLDAEGTALKCAPGNLQVGRRVFSELGHCTALARAQFTGSAGLAVQSSLGVQSISRVEHWISPYTYWVVEVVFQPSVVPLNLSVRHVDIEEPPTASYTVLLPDYRTRLVHTTGTITDGVTYYSTARFAIMGAGSPPTVFDPAAAELAGYFFRLQFFNGV